MMPYGLEGAIFGALWAVEMAVLGASGALLLL
jgi:hypothetical protein